MGLSYRVQQFFRVLFAQPDPASSDDVLAVLGAPLTGLFNQMLPSDQAHALRVYSSLKERGNTDTDLLAAALLHDIGKFIHKPTIFDRIVVVLANLILPGKVVEWGEAEPVGWRRPFSIARQHAAWGADLVASHGATPRLVELIRRHQEPPNMNSESELDRMLTDLHQADSEN